MARKIGDEGDERKQNATGANGADRDRTGDLLLAKPVRSR